MGVTRRKVTKKKVKMNGEYIESIAFAWGLGIALLLGGVMIMSFAHAPPPPISSEYEDAEAYKSAYSEWEKSTSETMTVGYLFTVGGISLLLFMCFTAIYSKKISHEDKRFFLALSIAISFMFIYIMTSFT